MLNKVPKIVLYILFVTFIIVTSYFLAIPIYYNWRRAIISPSRINNWQQARAYYQILSSIISIFVGVAGITLGYFYFVNKKETDAEISGRERIRKRLDAFIAELNKYDDLVNKILNRAVSDDSDLKITRDKIAMINDNMSIHLELGDKLLGLKDDEIRTIIRIHSFVEQNPLLMDSDQSALDRTDSIHIWSVKTKYIDLIQNARRVCLSKLE